jgi:SAM-dependent methyltransferase
VSGFSLEWLALREPADHRARNPDILAALKAAFADRESVTVIDLGCGTGSNLRATAPYLPLRQRWRLVDHDPALLAAARERLMAWADSAEPSGDSLTLVKEGRVLAVSFAEADLATGPEAALGGSPDLVTAAALFDLVSIPWIERFAWRLAEENAALYTALTYNGVEMWRPAHEDDPAILAAFHAHQCRDKGFGPSAGPGATEALASALKACRYMVKTGDSAWRLEAQDQALVRELAGGVAQAVRETGQVAEERVTAWQRTRTEGAACTIGHTDLLAMRASW